VTEIVIGAPTFRALSTALEADAERGAALYLSYDAESDRYLVRGIEVADEVDRISATELEITLAPLFLTRITRRARERRLHLALLHTHPQGCDGFSLVDDQAEHGLAEFMQRRNPACETFSMVLCEGKIKARRFATTEAVPVRYVGSEVVFSGQSASEPNDIERYDRQVRAFGVKGQTALHRLTVAIVGLGGTGSIVAQQLAYLGVGGFVLIDPDFVDETNLNRVVGALPAFIGRTKIDVAADGIGHVNPQARITRSANSVISEQGRQLLCSADCIFICTDSHVSRAFLSEFSYQYLIPAFDVGVSINANGGAIQAITGRTQMLAPGLPCLLCSNALDARVIREELMTPEQRAADPYFNEGGIRQPAVISLNGTMVSLSVTMFLSAFTGIPTRARWQSYDGLSGGVRVLGTQPDPGCPICGAEGLLATGDSRLLNFLSASAA
jgi:molybdopterin-synthase adenylyltransferase